MNMIIMAVIALLVLAIVAYLIFGAGGDINEAKTCTALGGECQSTCAGTDHPIKSVGSCPADVGGVCCIKLGTA